MNVDIVRNLFSYATVIFSNNAITLVYDASKEKYWSQDFNNDTIETLTNLVSASNHITIYPFRNKKMNIIFSLPAGSQVPWTQSYQAKKRLLSIEEIREDIRHRAMESGVTNDDVTKNVQRIMNSVDVHADSHTVISQLDELLATINNETRLERTIPLQSNQNYPYFKEAAINMIKYVPALELESPHDGMPGCAEFNLSITNQITIQGDTKRKLCDLLASSKNVDISADLDMEIIEVVFYS